MMMKKLIKTLGFILAVAWPSIVMAAPRTDQPQRNTNTNPNDIRNKVCIESPQTEKKCAQVKVTVVENSYACESLTSSWSIINLNSNGQWNMRFTCTASNSQPHTITIYCGNWRSWTIENESSFSYNCNYWPYWPDDEWENFNAYCTIDWETLAQTNPACIKNVSTKPGLYWECGNWIIEAWEDCDLGSARWIPELIWDYLDQKRTIGAGQFANNNYRCKNCKILDWGIFVYDPAECLYSDTPISVMDKEIMPFWWRLWLKEANLVGDNGCYQEEIIFDDDTSASKVWTLSPRSKWTLLKKSSMLCTFSIYNWYDKLQWTTNSAQTFTLPCFTWQSQFTTLPIYQYFRKTHQTTDFDWWSYYATVNFILWWLKNKNDITYWEYKLVLEKVDYQYCDKTDGSRKTGKRYWAICEVDFAVTKPYMMQVSTFGTNPVATDEELLTNYYDMNGSWIIDNTDLRWTINTDNSDYAVSLDAKKQMDAFEAKYKKLAVKINTNTISTLFGWDSAWVSSVSKVPNQPIYFVEWEGVLKLSQKKIASKNAKPYTIYVKWMDVEIEWNMSIYAMIITNQKISFTDTYVDKDSHGKEWSRCTSGWQVVQWIFVALNWFKKWSSLENTSPNQLRCPRWGLHIKWVLIWDNIDKLTDSRRSQLNSWFNVDYVWWSAQKIKTDRKKKIMEWASLLIEYSPELWKSLPPWADLFTESLEVYKR